MAVFGRGRFSSDGGPSPTAARFLETKSRNEKMKIFFQKRMGVENFFQVTVCYPYEYWTFVLNVHGRSQLVFVSGNHFPEFWIIFTFGYESSPVTTFPKSNGIHPNCWSNGISSVRFNVQVLKFSQGFADFGIVFQVVYAYFIREGIIPR